jgi:hypothetical protein
MFLEITNIHGNKTTINTEAIVKIHYCSANTFKIILKTKVFELVTEENYINLKEKLNVIG